MVLCTSRINNTPAIEANKYLCGCWMTFGIRRDHSTPYEILIGQEVWCWYRQSRFQWISRELLGDQIRWRLWAVRVILCQMLCHLRQFLYNHILLTISNRAVKMWVSRIMAKWAWCTCTLIIFCLILHFDWILFLLLLLNLFYLNWFILARMSVNVIQILNIAVICTSMCLLFFVQILSALKLIVLVTLTSYALLFDNFLCITVWQSRFMKLVMAIWTVISIINLNVLRKRPSLLFIYLFLLFNISCVMNKNDMLMACFPQT